MRCSDNRVQQLLDQPDLFARWQKNETEVEGARWRGGGGEGWWGEGRREKERGEEKKRGREKENERLEAWSSPVIVAGRLLSTSVCFPEPFSESSGRLV